MPTTPTTAPPTTLNYALTFFKSDGTTENFLVTLSGSSITDSDGNSFTLPGGVRIDQKNGLLMHKDQIVGLASKARLLPDGDLAIKMREDPRLTDGSMSSGQWSGPALKWPTLPAASQIGDVIAPPDTTAPTAPAFPGGQYTTATLAMPDQPPVPPRDLGELIVTPPAGPLPLEMGEGGGGGGGGEVGDGGAPVGGSPDFTDPSQDSVVPDTDPSGGGGGILGTILAALTTAGAVYSIVGKAKISEAIKWLGKGWGQAVGSIAGAVGLFFSMYEMGKNGFSIGALLGALTSSYLLYASLGLLGLAVVAAIAIVGYLIGRHGKIKDQELNTLAGDVESQVSYDPNAPLPGAPPSDYWGNALPAGSVFMIMAGITALGIGIDLSISAPANQVVNIPAALVPAAIPQVQHQLRAATNGRYNGAAALEGKAFIKRAPGEADKVVFVTREFDQQGNSSGASVNMMSLNNGGYLTSPLTPKDALMPFFIVDRQTGAIKRNPQAYAAIQTQKVLTRAANGGLSATGSAEAIRRAGFQPYMVDYHAPSTGEGAP